jgi:hypothetical protein
VIWGIIRHRDAQGEGIALIDIGHFASEHLIVDVLVKKLDGGDPERGIDSDVEASAGSRILFAISNADRCPFVANRNHCVIVCLQQGG